VKLRSGEEIIYADEANEFADAILELQSNKEQVLRLGKNARRVAEGIYDWNAIGNDLNKIFSSL